MASYEDTLELLEKLHSYDISQLPRREDLGSELSFSEAVEPVEKVLNLFRNIPVDQLKDLPENTLQIIESEASSTVQLLDEVASFSISEGDPVARRKSIIDRLNSRYGSAFGNLYNIVAYLATRQIDLGALETEAREKINAIEKLASDVESDLKKTTEDAKTALNEARKVAAEQGVSQQAQYFSDESTSHSIEADTWLKYTTGVAILLAIFAAASAFLHQIPILAPQNTYETIQLAISKFLVFGVIAYMLLLCAKTYTAHRHNSVINRHRQNALLTYRALVEAGSEEGSSRDIVLGHAASCIFAPQDTGFTKTDSDKSKVTANVIDAVPRAVSGTVNQKG